LKSSNRVINVTKEGLEFLQAHNIGNPHLNIVLILMNVLDKSKVFVLTNPQYCLTKEQSEIFWGLLTTRVQGFPLQYILKSVEFMGLDFYVDPRVLIPRPDTEVLVEAIINYATENNIKEPKILDIGTGSGAISVSLAYHIGDSNVTALDISEDALAVAINNAKSNKVDYKMQFIQSNLFKKIESSFDIIVSNPPYIPTRDIEDLMTEVKDFEPMGALDGGDDGLDFYRKIIDGAPKYLNPGGFLALEGGHNQGLDIKKLLEDNGQYVDIALHKDLAAIDRVVTAKLKKRDDKNEQKTNC
jgi:release factor glutamine methyltransferase